MTVFSCTAATVGGEANTDTDKDETIKKLAGKDFTREQYTRYMRRMEKLLEKKRDETFRPSLVTLRDIVASLEIDGGIDPSHWHSQFHNEIIAIQPK